MSVYDDSFLPTDASTRQPQEKLERYAQLYARYTNLIQLRQGDVMRHDMKEMQRAYDQGVAEFTAEQSTVKNKMGASFILADLNEYDRRCNITPKSFEDHVRISFAASGFLQVLMHFVVGNLNSNDRDRVFARATQLLSSNSNQPIPTFAPAVCKLRPDNAETLPVTPNDIAHWRLNPKELVGKCFVTTEEIMRMTFLVQDYYVKRSGPHYEVIYEDTGPGDVNIFEADELLAMVEDAELIMM